jgi:hypothetical protein
MRNLNTEGSPFLRVRGNQIRKSTNQHARNPTQGGVQLRIHLGVLVGPQPGLRAESEFLLWIHRP